MTLPSSSTVRIFWEKQDSQESDELMNTTAEQLAQAVPRMQVTHEVHADGADVRLGVGVILCREKCSRSQTRSPANVRHITLSQLRVAYRKTQQQAGLADSTVTNQEQLQEEDK